MRAPLVKFHHRHRKEDRRPPEQPAYKRGGLRRRTSVFFPPRPETRLCFPDPLAPTPASTSLW